MIGLGLVGAPLLACVFVLFYRSDSKQQGAWQMGVLGATVAFLFALTAVMGGAFGGDALFRDFVFQWVPSLGVSIHIGFDGLTLATIFSVTAIYMMCLLALDRQAKGIKPRIVSLLLSETGVLLTLTTHDLLIFLPAWLMAWLPLVLTVAAGSTIDSTRKATRRVSIQMSAAAGFYLAAVLALAAIYYGQQGEWTFHLDRLAQVRMAPHSSVWLLSFFLVSLGSGAAVFPFHSWLPFAARSFPLPILVALMVGATKGPLFLMVKLCVGVLPKAASLMSPVLVAVAVIGVFHAGLLSWTHRSDWRRLAAYVTSGLGALVLFGFMSLEVRAISGASLLTAANVLAVGAVLLGLSGLEAGDSAASSGTFRSESGVLSKPRLVGLILAVGTLAAVPPLSGFVGEFLLWTGCFDSYIYHSVAAKRLGAAPLLLSHPKLWTLVAVLAHLVLSAAVVHGFYKRFFQGYRKNKRLQLEEPTSGTFALPVLLPALLSLFMGVYPGPFLKPIEKRARELVEKSHHVFIQKEISIKPTRVSPQRRSGTVSKGSRGSSGRTGDKRPSLPAASPKRGAP